jgi:hypothetical protein
MTKTLRPKRRRKFWQPNEAPELRQRISFKKWTAEKLAESILLDYPNMPGYRQSVSFTAQRIREVYKAKASVVTQALMLLQRQGKAHRNNTVFDPPGARSLYTKTRTRYWIRN